MKRKNEGSDRAPRRYRSAIQRLPDFISLLVLFFYLVLDLDQEIARQNETDKDLNGFKYNTSI